MVNSFLRCYKKIFVDFVTFLCVAAMLYHKTHKVFSVPIAIGTQSNPQKRKWNKRI